MKKNIFIVIILITSITAFSILIRLFNQKEEVRIKNQAIDFTIQVQKLNCGDSLLISEFTHYEVIKELQKQLKNNNQEVWLGNTAYYSSGVGLSKNPVYLENDRFVYLLGRSSNSQFEIVIEDRKLDNDIYTAKCLSIFVSCN